MTEILAKLEQALADYEWAVLACNIETSQNREAHEELLEQLRRAMDAKGSEDGPTSLVCRFPAAGA